MKLDAPNSVDVIASGIHDAKNNMFDALTRVDVAARAIEEGRASEALPALAETRRAISASAERLSKLLSAYRLARHEDPVSMLPVDLGGFLDDVLIRVDPGMGQNARITLEQRGPDFWVFDRELVAECLVNALQNALRHARKRVLLWADAHGGRLRFGVSDDGPGFPDPLPAHPDGTRSGVGLFIAGRIAQLHSRHGAHGELVLGNGGPLGGAQFLLHLP